jgi:hypothetical protein
MKRTGAMILLPLLIPPLTVDPIPCPLQKIMTTGMEEGRAGPVGAVAIVATIRMREAS